jgi:hypothetical protein
MKRLVLISAAAGALAIPGVASAAHSRGVVVKVERGEHAVAIARGEHVSIVHARRADRLHVGQVIQFDARKRDDGTLAASDVRVVGRAERTKIQGVVVARDAKSFTLASGGVRFKVARADDVPAIGAKVEVEMKIENERVEIEVEAQANDAAEAEAKDAAEAEAKDVAEAEANDAAEAEPNDNAEAEANDNAEAAHGGDDNGGGHGGGGGHGADG